MAVTGAILVSGTFVAARHHFLSLDYGMKNSRMRKQIDELETEKRRLLLARENSSSPTEIKRVARKIGLAGETLTATEARPELASSVITAKPSQDAQSKVVKTVETKPTNYAIVPASLKTPIAMTKPSSVKSAKNLRESKRELTE